MGIILTLNTHAHDRTRARPVVAAGAVDPAARSAPRAVLKETLGRVVSEGVVLQAVPLAAPLVFPTPGGIRNRSKNH